MKPVGNLLIASGQSSSSDFQSAPLHSHRVQTVFHTLTQLAYTLPYVYELVRSRNS